MDVLDKDIRWWLLELLKAMYGLNDAPFAFQACQADFFEKVLKAIRSRFDENFMFWLKRPGIPSALATTHVDDNELGNERTPEGRAAASACSSRAAAASHAIPGARPERSHTRAEPAGEDV